VVSGIFSRFLHYTCLLACFAQQSVLFASASTPLPRASTRMPPAWAASVPTRFYTSDDLASVQSFADALFKTRAEGVFDHREDANGYMQEKLQGSEAARYNRIILASDALQEQFEAYNKAISDSALLTPEAWLEPRRMIQRFSCGAASPHERFVQKTIIRNAGNVPQTVIFMGDLHGSVHALLRNLLVLLQLGYLKDDFSLAENTHLFFLGDLVDRGLYGIETVYTILRLKNATWNRVQIVRGNHEDANITAHYGFDAEIMSKYAGPEQEGMGQEVRNWCNHFFASLPSAIFLGFHDAAANQLLFAQCCHGGIAPSHNPLPLLTASPDVRFAAVGYIRNPDGILDFAKHYEMNDVGCVAEQVCLGAYQTIRPDYLDGIDWVKGRGTHDAASYIMHRDDVTKCLHAFGLTMLIRGHQDTGSACKVLVDGSPAPVSWRLHPAFTAITPVQFFEQGISLADAPNCITLTTAAEGRGLPNEGFMAIRFDNDLAASRLVVYEPSLVPNCDPSAEEAAEGGTKERLTEGCIRERVGRFVSCKPLALPSPATPSITYPSMPNLQSELPEGELATPARWHESEAEAGLIGFEGFASPAEPVGPAGEARPLDFGAGKVQIPLSQGPPEPARGAR